VWWKNEGRGEPPRWVTGFSIDRRGALSLGDRPVESKIEKKQLKTGKKSGRGQESVPQRVYGRKGLIYQKKKVAFFSKEQKGKGGTTSGSFSGRRFAHRVSGQKDKKNRISCGANHPWSNNERSKDCGRHGGKKSRKLARSRPLTKLRI